MISNPAPPRFVPTLTDIVHPLEHVNQVNLQLSDASSPQNAAQLEDQIIHRVMQRVDLVLERRLREAVSQVILSHTQALTPHLREEITRIVEESVSQAVAQELAPPSF